MTLYSLPKDKAFLVSVKGLIINSAGEVLVLKVKDDDISAHDRGTWNLPGGLLEFGESFEEGLLREIKEETGLNVRIKKLVAVSDFDYQGFTFEDGETKDVRIVVIGYECECDGTSVLLDGEHALSEWVAPSDLASRELTRHSRGLVQTFLLVR